MADKNLNQVDGGQLTSTTSTRYYAIAPAATPSGFQDYWIGYTDLITPLTTLISINTGNISTLNTQVAALEDIISVEYHADVNSNFNFALSAYEHLVKLVLIWKAATPKIKIGTVGYGNDDVMPEIELDSTESGKYQVIILPWGRASSKTLYVTITTGTLTMVRYMTQVNSSLI